MLNFLCFFPACGFEEDAAAMINMFAINSTRTFTIILVLLDTTPAIFVWINLMQMFGLYVYNRNKFVDQLKYSFKFT